MLATSSNFSGTAGNIFSLSEELVNSNFNATTKELLMTPKEIEKKLNGTPSNTS